MRRLPFCSGSGLTNHSSQTLCVGRLNAGVRSAVEVFRHIKDWLSRRSSQNWEEIVSDDAGFTSGSRPIKWSEINSVAAFKRDMLTVDDVWFQLETDQGTVMICEEQPGFDKWESCLCKAVPAVATWRESVIQPPFAQNFSILYRRT